MLILGIGMIGAFGQGITAWEAALQRGWQPPTQVETAGGARPAYLVDFEKVADKTLLRKLRRADKLSKMAVLAAAGAMADSGLGESRHGRVGIILATALGPHVTTFEFLDGILDYGDAAASPTAFSHSVHNAAVSYVASSLAIQGPTLTVTSFSFAFQEALRLAQCWLDQGRCDRVLVGMAEEYGAVLGYIAATKLETAADGRIRPFAFAAPGPIPGEGSVFFLLGREDDAPAYCRIDHVQIGAGQFSAPPAEVSLAEADGLLPATAGYLAALPPGIPTAGYAPLAGSMLTGCAFSLATGALMLRRQALFATPVAENPDGITLITTTGPAQLATVDSIGCDCLGRRALTRLTKR